MVIDTAPLDLSRLDHVIEKVEFKLTVLARDERKVQALLSRERADPERRRVYFYDTRTRALNAHALILRTRLIPGEDDDSTVKLRPADLTGDGAGWRQIDDIEAELDVVGSKQVVSARLDGKPKPGEIEDVEAKKRPVASLFKVEQEALVKAYADGVSLDDLEVLGPVDARKWKLEDLDGFPYELCIEEWSLPDATRFFELSFKVDRDEAADAQTAFDSLLAGLRIAPRRRQIPKTPRVLKFFADRLEDQE